MQRITKTLLIVVTLLGLAQAVPSVCFGWSLLHPFASDDKPQTTMVSRTTQKPPSAWQKLTTGTKKFFNKTGETLGLKKKEPKKSAADRRGQAAYDPAQGKTIGRRANGLALAEGREAEGRQRLARFDQADHAVTSQRRPEQRAEASCTPMPSCDVV